MNISIEKTDKGINILLPDNENIELILCPAGRFNMGTPNSEFSHMRNERLHEVTLTKDFYLGKYTLTSAQMEALCKLEKDEEWEKTKKIYKNYYERFCGGKNEDGSFPAPVGIYVGNRVHLLLTELLKNYLPNNYIFDYTTESQWEYACRAGCETGLYNGKNISVMHGTCSNLDDIAWYYGNSGKKPHPVGQKMPNAWGFYDMLGNVWEHTNSSLCEFEEKETDPNFFSYRGYARVIRGGSYSDHPWRCRSSMRGQYIDGEARYFGTRIALVYNQ